MPKSDYCHACGSEFGFTTWRYSCGCCNNIYCDDCLGEDFPVELLKKVQQTDGDRFCKSCRKWYAEFSKEAKSIQLWSANYQGRVPVDRTKPAQTIRTGWHRKRDNAELEAKLIAHYNDCSIIYDSEFVKDTDSEEGYGDGTYYYTVWRVRCLAGVSLDLPGKKQTK